jgi:hypothetical protein
MLPLLLLLLLLRRFLLLLILLLLLFFPLQLLSALPGLAKLLHLLKLSRCKGTPVLVWRQVRFNLRHPWHPLLAGKPCCCCCCCCWIISLCLLLLTSSEHSPAGWHRLQPCGEVWRSRQQCRQQSCTMYGMHINMGCMST